MGKKKGSLEELQRRQTVAQLHSAGTQIRKEEMKRIKMSAAILLKRAKSIHGSIKDKESMVSRGLKNIKKIDQARTEKEESRRIISGIFDFAEDAYLIGMVQPEVDGIVIATNDIVNQLRNYGVCFPFPEFKSYPGITACKFTLEGVMGFLKGVTES